MSSDKAKETASNTMSAIRKKMMNLRESKVTDAGTFEAETRGLGLWGRLERDGRTAGHTYGLIFSLVFYRFTPFRKCPATFLTETPDWANY